VRLSEVAKGYENRIRIHWRTFPLIPDQRPGRRATVETQAGRRRAADDEPRASFVTPPLGTELPASSLPALTAVKCAERQGQAEFERLHERLFLAHFRDNLDIGREDVLWTLARESGLDMTRLEQDYAGGEAYQAAVHDYAEGMAWFGVSAVPTVIFNEKISLVGAVPEDRYRSVLDWVLAGEPGGLLPLDDKAPPAGATSPSSV
jgi:predicted DsbA family dithiol-disulfide isomerase